MPLELLDLGIFVPPRVSDVLPSIQFVLSKVYSSRQIPVTFARTQHKIQTRGISGTLHGFSIPVL